MKRLTKILLAVGAVAVVGGGTAFAVAGRGKGAETKDIVEVKRGDLVVTVAETGTIQPLTKVEVKSRIAGQVVKLFADVGDRVKKGGAVIGLDTTDAERDLAQAEADVAIARAHLAKLEAGARVEERAEARADVRQAEAESERARAEHDRARSGQEAGTLTASEIDQARAAHLTAQARLAAARARLARIEAGSRREDIAEAAAQLARAQVAHQRARDHLSYTTIRAPMTGVVIKRGVEAGEFVSPGMSALAQGGPIMTVADLSQLLITTSLNQIDVGKVRKGQAVEVRVDSAPGRAFRGRIRKVAPAAEAQKDGQNSIQTFAVETLVGQGEADATVLRPGMTADLDIQVTTKKAVLLLPVEAVVRGKGDEGTVTLPPEKGAKGPAETRKIKLGLANDHQVEIASGLAAGQKILVKPPSSAENEMRF